MHFKLITVFVDQDKADPIMEAAREAGATGATIIPSARGEGMERTKTFFGMALESQREMVLLLVEQHMARGILEKIAEVGEFDAKPGSGIAFQVDVEDVVGASHQVAVLQDKIKDDL